ncbi:MAG: hypothetical protein KDK03_07755 [Rhodobacteraceae bacterium]|nr:hypothetical protein [Paracoccaceae bacterium]
MAALASSGDADLFAGLTEKPQDTVADRAPEGLVILGQTGVTCPILGLTSRILAKSRQQTRRFVLYPAAIGDAFRH